MARKMSRMERSDKNSLRAKMSRNKMARKMSRMEHCYTCLGTAERDLLIEQGGNNLTQSSHSNTSHFMLRV